MVRYRLLWFCVFVVSSSSLVAFDETIPASDILKVWESTAIKNARVQFEEINRRFVEFDESEAENTKLITLVDGDFYYFQSSGMRLKYDDPERGECNLFRGKGKSVHDHKKTPPASVVLRKEGDTEIEKMAVTEAFRLWLDPSSSRYGSALRNLADTKLRVNRDKMGNERVEIEGKRKLTLAKEYDWRPISISQAKQDSEHPLYRFQFERSEQEILLLRNCLSTMIVESTDQPRLSSEWSISSLKRDVVTDADIDTSIAAPALVHDYTVTPANEYFLRKDGSKTPYSSKEHYKILDEMKAEKAKRESK